MLATAGRWGAVGGWLLGRIAGSGEGDRPKRLADGGGGEAATELDMDDRREGGFIDAAAAAANGVVVVAAAAAAGVPGSEAEGVSGPWGTAVDVALAADSSRPWSDAADVKTDSVSDMAVLSRRPNVGRAAADDDDDPNDGWREPCIVSRSDRPCGTKSTIWPFDW